MILHIRPSREDVLDRRALRAILTQDLQRRTLNATQRRWVVSPMRPLISST
jgi:hypothetical protein